MKAGISSGAAVLLSVTGPLLMIKSGLLALYLNKVYNKGFCEHGAVLTREHHRIEGTHLRSGEICELSFSVGPHHNLHR